MSYTHFGECTPENHILLSEEQASLYMTFFGCFLVSAACRWCRNWPTLIMPIKAKGSLPPVLEASLK
jgi:hypothetical protein